MATSDRFGPFLGAISKEQLAQAFYHVELARADIDNMEEAHPEDDVVTVGIECLRTHLDNASHWLQEVEQLNDWSLVDLLTEYTSRRAALATLLHAQLPPGTIVDVSDWAGCDEDWADPIYVTAEDPNEEVEYYDAMADLEADTLEHQATYILDQLRNG